MSELKCPNCNKFFSIDESDYLSMKVQYEREEDEVFNQIIEMFGSSCLDSTFKLIDDYLINIKKQYPEKADDFECCDETIKELYEDMDDNKNLNAE